MIRTASHYGYWGLFIIGLLGVLQSIYLIYQINQTNQLISQLNQGKDISMSEIKNAPPEVQLARASYLKNKHRYDEAQATLSPLIDQGIKKIRTVARYNLGNTYLEQAIELAESMQINEATSLAGLAKQAYRQALALDSQNWDAKYNLEVAMRLLPEMDRLTMQEDEPVPQEKAKLWATVPGFPRGLP